MEHDTFSDIDLSDADSIDEELPAELPDNLAGCGMLDKLTYASDLDETEYGSDEDSMFAEEYDLRPQRVGPRKGSVIHKVGDVFRK